MTGRAQLPVEGEVRNIPPAQRLLREGGICSCFWRLSDGTPVLCAMPTDEPHDHAQPARTTRRCQRRGHDYSGVYPMCRRCGDKP